MVRGAGIEPARSFEQQILSLSRLPVTTPAHTVNTAILYNRRMSNTPSIAAAEQALDAALAGGWPEPGSPYHQLIQIEKSAAQITHIGDLPGLLLDMGYVHAVVRSHGVTPEQSAVRDPVHIARQQLVRARLVHKPDTLATEALMPSDVLTPVADIAPHRVKPQTDELLAATALGWTLRIAHPHLIETTLPRNTRDIISIGDPASPDAVYWEAMAPDDGPHDTWSEKPADLRRAGEIYDALSSAALSPVDTHAFLLEQQAYAATETNLEAPTGIEPV